MFRHKRGAAIADFVDALMEGDPVALGFVGIFLVVGIGMAIFVLKVRRDLRREDEDRDRRYGRKK